MSRRFGGQSVVDQDEAVNEIDQRDPRKTNGHLYTRTEDRIATIIIDREIALRRFTRLGEISISCDRIGLAGEAGGSV